MRTNREDILVHSAGVIRMFRNAAAKLGEAMLNERQYAVSREAWIASVYLLGLRNMFGTPWWLRANQIENSEQDIIGYTVERIDERRTNMPQLPIQVFSRTNNQTETIFEAIRRKLGNTDLRNTSLVCYIQVPEVIQLGELHTQLVNLSPNVRDIWLIGNKHDSIMSVVEIFPDIRGIDVDLKAPNQGNVDDEPTFLHPFRGITHGQVFEHTGNQVGLGADFTFVEFEGEE